jgi:spore maturation protein CgeB
MSLNNKAVNANKKILIVGDWNSDIYEKPLYDTFKELGLVVSSFKWFTYFNKTNTKYYKSQNFVFNFFIKFQNKFLFGPLINKLNRDLIEKVNRFNPDIIFLYRPSHIQLRTIKAIKNNRYITSYHNDDPFNDYWFFQRHYLSIVKYMNINYVYREKNIRDLSNIKIKSQVLLPYPNISNIFPIDCTEKKFDVIFIGHYEDDGRDNAIIKLINDKSISFMLYGTDWHKSKNYTYIQSKLGDIQPLYKEEYNAALNSSKIALCFFSKINNDTYTRRTFEIPASGTMLLSEYSIESANILEPNIEAVYFNSIEELVLQAKIYLADDNARIKIANNGRSQVIKNHLPLRRAEQILDNYNYSNLM